MLDMRQNLENLDIKDRDELKKKLNKDEDIKQYDKEAAEELKPLEPFKEDTAITSSKKWTWPVEGRFCTLYQYWMLCHCLYYQVFVITRIAFEGKP